MSLIGVLKIIELTDVLLIEFVIGFAIELEARVLVA